MRATYYEVKENKNKIKIQCPCCKEWLDLDIKIPEKKKIGTFETDGTYENSKN